MKCYTMDQLGIAARTAILVGEPGRGRKQVAVPYVRPEGHADVLVECRGPATSALVLIPDQSGFRGGWSLRDAYTAAEWDEAVRPSPSHRDGCPNWSRWSTPVAGQGCPGCDSQAEWRAGNHERSHRAQVIAEGYCAQGNAGGMGGGPEYLLVLAHGQAVEICRSGRLYGRPSCTRLECVAGRIVATNPRADAEERAAGAKWDNIADQSGAEPVEVTLGWGGGGTNRRQAEAMSLRPILVDAAGAVHVFQGASIPGVVTVIEDVSLRSGMHRSRHELWRCLLHPGVTYRGDESPEAATAAPVEEQTFGMNLGGLLAAAGVK